MSDDQEHQATWPREIWAEARGEHEPDGRHVFSKHATVARFDGDREREFHRYVDGDIYDSAERYWRHRLGGMDAATPALIEAGDILAGAAKRLSGPPHAVAQLKAALDMWARARGSAGE